MPKGTLLEMITGLSRNRAETGKPLQTLFIGQHKACTAVQKGLESSDLYELLKLKLEYPFQYKTPH